MHRELLWIFSTFLLIDARFPDLYGEHNLQRERLRLITKSNNVGQIQNFRLCLLAYLKIAADENVIRVVL